ncbi:glycoside hydrolase family 57 protein [Candidatus Saccharibacteria bacterium]|nr:glycoside hydrolase family 57 protein [Candidatus Saccharibacteria bacterium]
MRAICLYLHIHQPIRYRQYSAFDISNNSNYFIDDYEGRQSNERIFKKVTEKSYRPMLSLLEKNMKEQPEFKVSFSITGTWLEQASKWAPELIEQIKRMVSTGHAEIIGETYYHSLAFFYNKDEFEQQVKKHQDIIEELFNYKPKIFRNTELAYNDELASWAENAHYDGILAEGWDRILRWRSPNYVYQPINCKNLKLLLKNYRLSDDIAFRFSNRKWPEWPLTPQKYISWINESCLNGNLVNLFMDFETFGEHQWKDTGIFEFMDAFIKKWLGEYENKFLTASEACKMMGPVGEISMPETITWADTERDLSAWDSNSMQKSAMNDLYSMRDKIIQSDSEELISDWERLTTSDHAYSMCTKYWNDGDVHAYFSAYASPYESFMYFMNILKDLNYRINKLQ